LFNEKLNALIGLSGVEADENTSAQRWGRRFEIPMILLAFWILLEWFLRDKAIYSILFDQITDWVVWLFFVLETTVLTSLVDNKFGYLRRNWMNLFIICIGVPLFWGGGTYAAVLRAIRVLLILPLLLNTSEVVRKVLVRNHLATIVLAALVFTTMSGFLIAGIDPGIENVWQGIWWAWVTVATVGYGDTVPVSAAGKVFAAFVIMFGVGFFAMLTASFSAYFISRGEVEIEEEEIEEIDQLMDIENRIAEMETTLKRIEARLHKDRQESDNH